MVLNDLPMDIKRDRLITKLKQELGGVVLSALGDVTVVEIALNSDGRLWAERLGEPMSPIGHMSAPNAMSLLGTIADSLDTEIHRDRPIVEGELVLDGSRIEGLIPPLVSRPIFCIRKRARQVFSLEDYQLQGILSAQVIKIIRTALQNRRNIVIAGGTGSGKTTFSNAILNDIAKSWPTERLVILEDTIELQCVAENTVTLRTSSGVDMQSLLKATMRLRPDRIVVGEVRGREALDLLKAWNTGHPGGLATLHANNAVTALTRLEQLVAEAGVTGLAQSLIAESVDIIIAISRAKSVRVITEIIQVTGWKAGYQIAQLFAHPLHAAQDAA